jgi:hypothetical protein
MSLIVSNISNTVHYWGTLRIPAANSRSEGQSQFISFDPSGGVKLTWTVIGGKLSSYWQLPGSSSEFGDGFSEESLQSINFLETSN